MAKPEESRGLQIIETEAVTFRSLGLDEKWLQKFLADNPDAIGKHLGADLKFIGKEIYEPRGGRLDLIFQDSDEEARYCVELMLGPLNESHFVRANEYWDEERTKNSRYDHVAVIIAEEVAGRFSNLFALIAKTIPIVAFKAVALKVNEQISIQFVKVLDFTEHRTDEETVEEAYNSPPKSQEEWIKDSSKDSMKAVQLFNSYLKTFIPDLQLTFNKYHIALGTTEQNFAWHHPRRKEPYSYFEIMVGKENIEEIKRELGKIEKTYSTNRKGNKLKFQLHAADLEDHQSTIEKLIKCALANVGYSKLKAA